MTPEQFASLREVFARDVGPEPELPAPRAPLEVVVPNIAPAAPPAPAPAAAKKRAKLYDPSRRGYMRATREEGIGEELKAMKEEAQGSPFFGGERAATDPRARLGIKPNRRTP